MIISALISVKAGLNSEVAHFFVVVLCADNHHMFCCGGGKKEEAQAEPSAGSSNNNGNLSPPAETAPSKIEAPPPQQEQPRSADPPAQKQEDKQKQEEKKAEEKVEEKKEEKKVPSSPMSARQNRKNQKSQQKEEKAAAVIDMLFAANDRSERNQWVTTADSNKLSNHVESDSDSESESLKGARKTPLAILDTDLKSSGLRFSPMRFAPQEKILLRDNMSSVNKKDIQPKFNRLSHDHIKLGAYLGAAIRLVYKDHAYKIKRISYDRPLLHNGLLYFIDAMERNGKGSFHIWLLLRLVVIKDDSAKIENPEPVMMLNKKTRKEEPRPLITVHDMYCKECRHRKPCDHKFKASQRITDYTFGLYIKFPVKLEGNIYLYAITLNSPMQAALSSRVFLSATAKKQAERARKEKEREESSKEKYSDAGSDGSGFDHSSDSSSAQSFSEVPTEQTGAVDLAQDYMDEDSFFERSYMSFRKAEPSQKERRKGGMLDRGSEAGNTGTDDYNSDETTDESYDPDEEYDVPDDDEDLGQSSGGGALGVLDQLRNQG